MTRTAPFSKAAIRNACIAAAFALPPIGAFAYGTAIQNTCVAGNPSYENGTGLCTAKNRSVETAYAERKAKEQEAEAKAVREESQRLAKIAEEREAAAKAAAAAEAKFKAEGWFQLKPGIYGRWCTQTCSRANVIGSSTYWLLEVWAKDRAAGDIYARVNILRDGVVVGWTNETAYLSQGQRGVLTFSKYSLPGSPSSYSAQLTEFNARG